MISQKAATEAVPGKASRTAIERSAIRQIATNAWRQRPLNDDAMRELLAPPSLKSST